MCWGGELLKNDVDSRGLCQMSISWWQSFFCRGGPMCPPDKQKAEYLIFVDVGRTHRSAPTRASEYI